MSSWTLPDLRATWKAVTDRADEEENVNKVTLPVGLIIGVIGILAASWLIWCVLGGCDSKSASAESQKATIISPQKSTRTTPGIKPMFGFLTSDAPKAKKATRTSFAYNNIPERVRVDGAKAAELPGNNKGILDAAGKMADALKKMEKSTSQPLQGVPKMEVEAVTPQFLLRIQKEVKDVTNIIDSAVSGIGTKEDWSAGKWAGRDGFNTMEEQKRRAGMLGGGKQSLTGLPLVVIIIMMLVVRAKLTDRR